MSFKRILFYIGLVAAVLLVSAVLSVFLFKDRIIASFIAEANKHLNTPVKAKKIDVGVFKNFPYLSIHLIDVYVEDSHPGEYPLLTAGRISFKLHPLEAYRGTYRIRGLSITDSETNLKINAEGQNNYTILKPSATESSSQSAISLELKNVTLKNSRVSYYDLTSRQHLVFTSGKMAASITSENDLYDIEANGELHTETISIDGKSYLTGKGFLIESVLRYDDVGKSLVIKPSELRLKRASFLVSGTYSWKDRNTIDLKVDGKETDIQTLLSLLPESISGPLAKYQSKGEVYFSSVLRGGWSSSQLPGITVNFGFNNATIYHPDYKSRIESASLQGTFTNSNLANSRNASLTLQNIKGTLNKEPFTADFTLKNFADPEVNCAFKGNVDAAALYGFFPLEQITSVTGRLFADISFKGKTELLKSKSTAQQVSTRGTVDLFDINFKYGKDKIPLSNLKGSLQFSNNDLALSNVSAKFGNSDFLLNGFFKNIITFLLFDNQPVGIETDLKSDYLDVNQLFAVGYGSSASGTASEGEYEFRISPHVYLNFNCDIRKLVYKRFTGNAIRGDLLVKNKVAVSRNLSVAAMGGRLSLSGIVDANNPKAIDVVCTGKANGIHLDSAFYVFENFDQTFIQDKHLKGHVTADVNLEMVLNQNLRLFQETLVADIKAVIKNGELNNFEPMKKLNRFLDDEGLNNLRFSDLQNDIHIENKTIYLPQMEIRSNVTDIKVKGTHTFDQRIDYRLITPLRGKKKFTDQQAGTAVDSDGNGQTRLYLKITGTTDDYKIGFDTEAIKKKIVDDIKKEFREIKDGFKKREEQKKKEPQPEEDEYFDW